MTYDEKINALKAEYEQRILAIVAAYGEVFRAAGYTWSGDTYQQDDSEYAWAITLLRPGTSVVGGKWPEDAVDVVFTLCEERVHERVEEGGVAFRLDLTEVSGRILGQQSPYNYTEWCWIRLDAKAEIAERFRLFEDADPAAAVSVAGGTS